MKPPKLDVKDKKLLLSLDFHARTPYSKLAKSVGLSKQGVEYKLNALIKKDVIQGFYPVINVPKLGYLYCRLLVTFQSVTAQQQGEIFSFLKAHPKVFWLLRMQGVYDLLIVIWAKTVTEFKEFIQEFEDVFGGHIKKRVETLATDVIHYQHRYLTQSRSTEEIHIRETQEWESIDKIDEKILQALCKDARMQIVAIAQTAGISAKVAAYRIKRMEKCRIIEGYRPLLNHHVMGYTYYKLFLSLHKISKKELRRLQMYLKTNPAVLYLVEGIGVPADLDIELMVQSNQELFTFIEELKFRFPALIEEYQTVIFMETLKVKYFPSEYGVEK